MQTFKMHLLTSEGYEKLKYEYEDLLKQRPDAVEHLKKARELGDLSENGYYKASRAKLTSIDHRIFRLKSLLKQAKIAEPVSTETVSLGCKVVIRNERKTIEYRIVSRFEANPSEGKISDVSPLGRELLGKRVADNVEINTLLGTMSYKILEIIV